MVKKEAEKKAAKKAKTSKKETVKKESYFKGVKKELSKVKWPKASEVIKYTIATIVFIVIVIGFFGVLNLLMSLIKGLFV